MEARRIPPGSRGVTLIELLTVLAIISVAAAFVMPPISSLLSGQASDKAAAMASDALVSARQLAISKGLPIAVAFSPQPDSSDKSQGVLLLSGVRHGASVTWTPAGGWNRLPQGAFVSVYERSGNKTYFSQPGGALPSSLPVKFDGLPVSNYFYIIYRPDGTIDAPQIAPSVSIRRFTQPNTDDYIVLAQENTGRVKIIGL